MTCSGPRLSTIVRTTVVLPEPDPPATPMTIGSDPDGFGGACWHAHGLTLFFTVFHSPDTPARRPMRVKLTSAVGSV